MTEKKVGDLIEGYRILKEVGRGAASIIYLVQDPKTKQIWALKHVEKTEPKDQRFLDQAESEYKIASELDHPSIRKIVRLIKKKTNLMQTKELFLVMEFVDGISEDRQQPRTFEKATDIFEQVAQALAHMHARGYVVSGVFFGIYCVLVGYLFFRSRLIPRLVGALMQIGGAAYLVNSFAILLAPAVAARLPDVTILGGIGELSLALWLTVKGVRGAGASP